MKTNKFFFLGMFLIVSNLTFSQAPTDNPYRARYGATLPAFPYHWTDSIRWNNVVNIQDYANQVQRIDDPGEEDDAYLQNDWLSAFNAAQNALVSSGGGVIFFPVLPQKYDGEGGIDPGKDSAYFFSDDIRLKSNVILRGVTPPNLDAKQTNFTPPSYIEFPKYRGGTSVSVPNSTSFKEITVDTTGIVGPGKPGFRNIGVVYLDVNRGRFAAHPTFVNVNIPGGGSFGLALEKPRNVLILGMRSNNVAIPDLGVPDNLPAVPAAVDRLAKRWSWRMAANVDVYVSANCIIAGCRMNDYLNNNGRGNLRRILNNSFNQSNYIPNAITGEPPCTPTPDQAKFDYNAHYGILLNRLKKNGYNSTLSFQSNASPAQEPELYATGNVVVDNWIFKNTRVAIQAAGFGLIVKGNISKDDVTKQIAINPGGTGCLRTTYPPANTPTYENRGIDIAGWNVLVDSNTVEAYRHKLLPSNQYTSDGEGWYFQGPSGSTAKNITISNNRYIGSSDGFCDAILNTNINKGFNGFTNTVKMENILVFNNDNGGIPFRIEASLGATPPSNYTLTGFKMYNNTNLHSIKVLANGCGDSSFVYNNSKGGGNPACGIPDLQVDCFTSINANLFQRNENSNTGFSTWPSNPNGDDRPGCGNPCPNGGPPQGFPSGSLTLDAPCYTFGQSNINIQLDYTIPGGESPDSVVLFRGQGSRVQKITSGLAAGQGTTFFSGFTASSSLYDEAVYSVIYKQGYSGQTSTVFIKICVGVENQIVDPSEIIIYPNPSKGVFQIVSPNQIQSLIFADLTGRMVLEKKLDIQGSEIDASNLKRGIYLFKLKTGNQQIITKKLIVE
jgi:hypothetical protein